MFELQVWPACIIVSSRPNVLQYLLVPRRDRAGVVGLLELFLPGPLLLIERHVPTVL